MKETKKISIRLMIILCALIPLTTALLALSIVAGKILTDSIEENTKEELEVAASSLREYYEYDLINGIDLVDGFCEYDTEYIDRMHKTGVDFTLFNKDVRFMTSIKDNSGKRIEGTKASVEVWNTVKRGESYYSDDVIINGIDYYVSYQPIGTKNEVLGMAFSGKPATDVQEAERSLYVLIFSFAAGLEIIFAIIACLIAKKVSDPLKSVSVSIEKIADGYTDIKTEATTHVKETGALITASNKLSGILGSTVRNIKDGSSTLKNIISNTTKLINNSSNRTDQINQSVDNLSTATTTLAENVQNVNASIYEMSTKVDNIVESTRTLNEAAKSMDNINKEAAESISSMVKSSDRSATAVADITENIKASNESISKISGMVGIITDIASQTNLLALNASIEAARAGESGRGFAVVAEEIKNLAEQSNKSADEIKSVVITILEQSTALVEKSEGVRETIETEKAMLSETQQKFTILGENIATSVSEISAVSEKAGELGRIKDTITEAVTDLSAISEENAATNDSVAEEIAVLAKNMGEADNDCTSMNSSAEDLDTAISYFK